MDDNDIIRAMAAKIDARGVGFTPRHQISYDYAVSSQTSATNYNAAITVTASTATAVAASTDGDDAGEEEEAKKSLLKAKANRHLKKKRRRQQEDAKLASSRAYIDQVDAVNRVWRGTLSMLYPRITALTVRWDNAAGNVTMDVPCAGAKPGFMRAYLADASHEFAAQVRYRSGQRLRLFCTVAARSAAEEAGNPGSGGGGGGGEHTVTSAEMAMSIASKSQRTAVVDREPKQGSAAKAKPQPKGEAQDKAARRSSGSGGNGAAQRAAEAQVNSLRAHVPCWRTCVVQPRAPLASGISDPRTGLVGGYATRWVGRNR